MINATKIFYIVVGILTILGGVMGYVKAGSMASLIAGSVSGLVLLGAGGLLYAGKVDSGLILGILITVAIAGQFVPKVMQGKAAPHIVLMAVLGLVGIVLTLISFSKK
jgi:uncharacterized membrane protein (UPF0136 family)